jgi:hypothetical protein
MSEKVPIAGLKDMFAAVQIQSDYEPGIVVQVAGLHDHRYRHSEWEVPIRGFPVQLEHNWLNEADPNAVEVRFNYQFMGHLPADVAAVLAPHLDQGKEGSAWVIDPGNGYSWSFEILILGWAAAAVQEARKARIAEVRQIWVEQEAHKAAWNLEIWNEEDRIAEQYRKDYYPKAEVNGFGAEVNNRRNRRRQDLAVVFDVPLDHVNYQQTWTPLGVYHLTVSYYGESPDWTGPATARKRDAA